VQDCQWIQKLHSLGLLESSFLPDSFTESIRQVSRHRKNLLENAADYISRMQKALRQMNIRLDNVLRDVTGQSGQLIIKAILDGERNATKLMSFAHYNVHASKIEIEKALTGDWRQEFLIELKHSFELYHVLHDKIQECDKEIERLLEKEIEQRHGKRQLKSLKKSYDSYGRKRVNKNDPKIDLDRYSYELSGGIDLMQIPAIGRSTLLALISEVGLDVSKFSTYKQFSSWLGLSPNNTDLKVNF
jgi:transposase